MVEGSVFPDMLFWVLSLEIFIMCLLGGWFTFFGPMLGAAIMVSLRTFVGSYTDYWTLVLGVVLILLIFFLPEGIMGIDLRARCGRASGAPRGRRRSEPMLQVENLRKAFGDFQAVERGRARR